MPDRGINLVMEIVRSVKKLFCMGKFLPVYIFFKKFILFYVKQDNSQRCTLSFIQYICIVIKEFCTSL